MISIKNLVSAQGTQNLRYRAGQHMYTLNIKLQNNDMGVSTLRSKPVTILDTIKILNTNKKIKIMMLLI